MPNFHGSIVADGGYPVSGLVEGCRPHGGGVGGQSGKADPVVVVFLVHLDAIVITAAGHNVQVRVPYHLFHVLAATTTKASHRRSCRLVLFGHLKKKTQKSC